jgi:hypothetical protein
MPYGTVFAMNNVLTSRNLVALSIVYGGAIAVLAVLGVDFLATFAVVGAIAIGVLWALRGVLGSGRSES